MRESANRGIRIAKFTLDGYFNYGNVLQNYALQQVLLRYANQVDTIWTQSDTFLPDIWWKWTWKMYVKYLINWKNFRTKITNGDIGREMVRQAKIRDFSDRYISYHRVPLDALSDRIKQYDYCVVGSDQVWNPHFGNYHQFFLGFAPEEKRLSYAASISTIDIPAEEHDFFVQGIKGMKALSVREQAGADLIEQLTGRKAEVHLDPTLLLTADEWRSVSRRPTWYHGGEYLLTYFLGRRPAQIDAIAEELGLTVVNLLDENVYEHYVTGVDEFLWAIDHASLVYTDSFHGSVFPSCSRRRSWSVTAMALAKAMSARKWGRALIRCWAILVLRIDVRISSKTIASRIPCSRLPGSTVSRCWRRSALVRLNICAACSAWRHDALRRGA